MDARSEGRPLAEVLATRTAVTELIEPGELARLIDPERYIGTAVLQVERLVERLAPRAL